MFRKKIKNIQAKYTHMYLYLNTHTCRRISLHTHTCTYTHNTYIYITINKLCAAVTVSAQKHLFFKDFKVQSSRYLCTSLTHAYTRTYIYLIIYICPTSNFALLCGITNFVTVVNRTRQSNRQRLNIIYTESTNNWPKLERSSGSFIYQQKSPPVFLNTNRTSNWQSSIIKFR